MIIDYADWRPANQHALLNTVGAVRYLSHDTKKAITAEEMAELHGWGIATALVFEDAATRATLGTTAGTSDGAFAMDEAQRLGVPRHRPIYIALDFDIQDYAPNITDPRAKLGPVGEYLSAFSNQLSHGFYEAGVYGGYWAVNRAISANVARWGWQTIAWSPTEKGLPVEDQRIALYQPGMQVLGGNADVDFAAYRDWGQFRKESRMLIGAQA